MDHSEPSMCLFLQRIFREFFSLADSSCDLIHTGMSRGRKPKPAKSVPGSPIPPDHLNAEAKLIFSKIAEDLLAQGSCVATDSHLIALYAEQRGFANELRRAIDGGEKTTKSEGYGATKAHPLLDKYLAALKASGVFLTKLGLTPASRPKSQMGDDDVSGFHE